MSVKEMNNAKDERGVVLIVSIMILALVLGIALAVSALTIKDFKTQSETASSSAALFAADSGMEEALYNHFNTSPSLPVTYTGNLSNSTSYESTLTNVQNLEGHLHVDETRQFSLINNYIEKITLHFWMPTEAAYDTPVVPGSPPPSMVYRMVSYPDAATFTESEIEIDEGMCDLACGQAGWEIPIDFSIDKDHVLRIKPVKNGVKYQITVTTGLGSFKILTLESTGFARNGTIKRALYTELSDEAPVMGMWDYVLLSGSDLD